MKKLNYLILTFFVFLSISCDEREEGEQITDLKTKNFVKAFNFNSLEEVEQKEKSFIKEKEKRESSLIRKMSNQIKFENEKEDKIISSVTSYHKEKLKVIDEIRNELNFISLQSIADEINSLKLISPEKSQKIYDKHSKFLTDYESVVRPKSFIAFPNITNSKGILLLNDININSDLNESISTDNQIKVGLDFQSQKKSAKLTGRTRYKDGVIASKDLPGGNKIVISWAVGRTQHRTDFGVRFYRPYTEYSAHLEIKSHTILVGGVIPIVIPISNVPYPVTYMPNSSAKAGFENFTHPVLGDAFFINFPRGTGQVLRNDGGKKTRASINLFGSINPSGNFEVEIDGKTYFLSGDYFESL